MLTDFSALSMPQILVVDNELESDCAMIYSHGIMCCFQKYSDFCCENGKILGGMSGFCTVYTNFGEEYVGKMSNYNFDGLVYYRNIDGSRGKIWFDEGNYVKSRILPAIDDVRLDNVCMREIVDVNGDKYVGELDELGRKSGFGELVGADGSLFKGFFLKGRMHGVGKIVLKNGDIIQGLFANGAMNGYCCRVSNSIKQFGVYKNARLNGWAMQTLPNGVTIIAKYKNDKIVSKQYIIDADGNIVEK